MPLETFDKIPNDTARYAVGHGREAVALAACSTAIAVDIETGPIGTSRRWDITAVAIATEQEAHVLDPVKDQEAIRDALRAAETLVFHNAAYDVPTLVHANLLSTSDFTKIEDTLVMARLAEPGERISKSLGDLAERHLGAGYAHQKHALEQGFKAVTGSRRKADVFEHLGLDSPAFCAYAAFDPVMTIRLWKIMPGLVRARMTTCAPFPVIGDPEHLIRREQTVNQMMMASSTRGLLVDHERLDSILDHLDAQMQEADSQLIAYGIDPHQTALHVKSDVVAWLAQRRLLPPGWPRLKDGSPTRDARWLVKISHPVVSALIAKSRAERFVGDYADKVLRQEREGLIHPQMNVLIAATGRMSCSSPPLQQYPPEVRPLFSSSSPMTSLDWASIEPLFIAAAARETEILELFAAGGDLYEPVAEAAGVARKTAKTILLAQLYGQGTEGLATSISVTPNEAQDLIARVMDRMPAVQRLIQTIQGVSGIHGIVPTLSGRVLPIPRSRPGAGYAGYLGVNYYVQGSCYDLLSEALYSMHKAGLAGSLRLAVHDELIVDSEAADEVERIMVTPPPALVDLAGSVPPLRVGRTELGNNWAVKS